MNRNVESHFANVPRVDIPRSRFDRSHGLKTAFNVGELVPTYLEEVLPGDTVQLTSSKVVRLQTLLRPIFDNMYLDQYFFFVPMRLIWDHWKEFCGENTQDSWAQTTTYKIPTITTEKGFEVGSIADFLGLPPGKKFRGNALDGPVSHLPFRAYALICNEFFRDENVTRPIDIYKGDNNMNADNTTGSYVTDVQLGGKPFIAAKFHDRFTSSLPAPQKTGKDGVRFPLNWFYAPVGSVSNVLSDFAFGYDSRFPQSTKAPINFETMNEGSELQIGVNTSTGEVKADQHDLIYPTNLVADLTKAVGGITINELRLSFQMQRFFERLARGGSRYTEMVKSFFGVSSPDARLQRPEYLGGNRIPLNINQVNNTSEAEDSFVGDLGANSVTGNIHKDFIHSFTEHGYIIGLSVVRYDHTYTGVNKLWRRETMYDFYWPTFANLGEMPVRTGEIVYIPDKQPYPMEVFGYQEAWSEYRYSPNLVSGRMRPDVPQTLASWHLADDYDTAPTLSDEWIREDKTNVDRVLAVTSAVSEQVFADFYFQSFWTRCMPVYSVPGLIDHH